MQIINPNFEDGDYHVHSITYSDGLNTIDELVQFAGRTGLKELAITDHSQATTDYYHFSHKTHRSLISRWKNVHNEVKVIFGVEADLLDETGNICLDIEGKKSAFNILSAHHKIYSGNRSKINEAYIKAMERNRDKIKFLGHPCIRSFQEYINIEEIVEAANEFGIGVELNCANLVNGKTDLPNLDKMLKRCNILYVNSDAHTLWELQEVRKKGYKYLKERGYL